MKKISKIIKIIFFFNALFLLISCTQPNTDTDSQINVKYTTTLGNGNYVMHNFRVTTGCNTVDESVNKDLTKAESYIKGLVKGFSENLKAKYSFESIEEKDAFKLSNTYGFDFTINRIHNTCEPIMVDIIKNIDTPLDRSRFIRYYHALSNEAYKYGFGSRFGIITTEENSKKNYEDNKASVIRAWTNLHNIAGVEQPFDMKADIEDDNCLQTTIGMDALITAIAPKMGLQPKDLRNAVNLSFTVDPMKSWHCMVETTLPAHYGCALTAKNMVSVMTDTTVSLSAEKEASM